MDITGSVIKNNTIKIIGLPRCFRFVKNTGVELTLWRVLSVIVYNYRFKLSSQSKLHTN